MLVHVRKKKSLHVLQRQLRFIGIRSSIMFNFFLISYRDFETMEIIDTHALQVLKQIRK